MEDRLVTLLINRRRHPLQELRNQARKAHLPLSLVRLHHMGSDSSQAHLRAPVLIYQRRPEAARIVKLMQKGYMCRQRQVVVYQVQPKLSL